MRTTKTAFAALVISAGMTNLAFGDLPIPSDNLQVWFKADDGIGTDGAAGVISWANKAPLAAQGSSAAASGLEKPTIINGGIFRYPSVRFNGVSNILKTGAFDILAASNDVSVFMVAKPDPTQSNAATIIDHDYRGPISPESAVQPISVVSKKAHGTAGTFGIELPVSGNVGIESRGDNGTSNSYQVVFTFATPVTFSGASITSGAGTVAGASTASGGTEVVVDLAGVANAQTIALTLSAVNDGTTSGDVVVRMGVLVGDVNASGTVSASDLGYVKAQSGQPVTSANFRADVNANGSSTSSDSGLTKAQSGTALPQNTIFSGFSFLQGGSAVNGYQFVFGSGGFTQGNAASGTAALKNNEAQIITVVKSGVNQTLRVNQAQRGTAVVSTTIEQGANVFAIGGSVFTSGRFFKGDVAEIIIYNRAVSASERGQIVAYLDAKYKVSPTLPVPNDGLRVWFDAGTNVVKDATGLVASWSDRVNSLTAQMVGPKPLWAANSAGGRPGITFNGVNTFLRTAKVDVQGGSDDISVFTVFRPGSSQVADAPIIDHASATPLGFGLLQNGGTTNAYRFLFRDGGTLQGGGAAAQAQAGQLKVVSGIKDGANQSLYVNGTLAASTSVATSMDTGRNILALGGSSGDSRCFNGDIAEVLIYNRALSAAERQQVEAYLSDAHALYGTTFTFNLDASYPTSAGVYNSAGTLIRTLWRKLNYGPGAITRSWDGKDDTGVAVPAGNYQVRVLYHNVVYTYEGAVGNTSTATPAAGFNIHKGGGVHNLAVDGSSAFYVTNKDEGLTSIHYFNTADTRQQSDMAHKDYLNFFEQVATDGQWVYVASKKAGFPESAYKTFVTAFTVADRQQATFTGGTPYVQPVPTGGDDNNPFWPSCIDVDTEVTQNGQPSTNVNAATGIAVQKTGSILAVAHGPLNVVRLFSKQTGVPLQCGQPSQPCTISVQNPQGLAFAPNGDLWVIAGSSVVRYTSIGTAPTIAASTSGTTAPVSVAVHPTDNDVIYVADGGSSQTVKRFNAAGVQQAVFGKPGGWYNAANGPDVAPNGSGQISLGFEVGSRLEPVRHTPLAVQADGSFWIGDGATGRMLRLSSTGAILDQIGWLTHNSACSVDYNNPTRVIGDDFLEYQVDYTRPVTDPLSWTLKKNWAVGLQNRYLGGARIGSFPGMRSVVTLGTRTYALLADDSTPDPINSSRARNAVVELPSSGPLRFTGSYVDRVYTAEAFYGTNTAEGAPAQRASLESDGSLRFCRVEAGPKLVCYQRPVSFDAAFNPQWGTAAIIASAAYNNFDPWFASEPFTNDVGNPISSSGLLITLDTSTLIKPAIPAGPQFPATGFHLGGLPSGGDLNRWGFKASPGLLTNIPFDGMGSFTLGDGVQASASVVPLSVGRNVVYDYFGEFWNQSQASQWMHFYDDGLFVGQFGTTGDQLDLQTRRSSANNVPPLRGFAGFNAWPAMVAVNASNQKAVDGINGETYVWSNDQNNWYGLARWHMLGANTIREVSGTGSLNSNIVIPAASPVPYPTRLLATPGNGAVTLSWSAASGASTYNVKYSDRSGGPYQLLSGSPVSGTTLTTSLANGTRRYYIVSATNNDATPSNEASVVPFDTIGKAGQLTGSSATPWQVTSSAVLLGQPSLNGISSVLGDLVRNSIGTNGYVIYNWGGLDGNGVGIDAQNPASGVTITKGATWQNGEAHFLSSFQIDGRLGEDSALYVDPNITGTIDIAVGDPNVSHFLTIFCPTLADGNPHGFTAELKSQGLSTPSATYTVNDNAGDNHIFQFQFKGNVRLEIKSTGTNPFTVNGSLQAVFVD